MDDLLYGMYTLTMGLALIIFRDFLSAGTAKINRLLWRAKYTSEQEGVPKVLFPLLGVLFCVIGLLSLLRVIF